MKPILFILITLLLLQQAVAQDKMGVISIYKNNREGKRKALVLANQNYQYQPPLKNTLRDADSMAVALRYLGFEVMLVKDKELPETQDAIDQFVASLQAGDVAFIYYSGHGLGYRYDNFLLPINFNAQCASQIPNRAISLRELTHAIQDRSVRNLLLVVDACRNQSFGESCPDKSVPSPTTQLVPPEQNPNGMLLAFATDYGQTASYLSTKNRNSLYTESLLIYLRQPLELQEIFTLTARRTHQESQKFHQLNDKFPIQEPILSNKIYDDYFFLKRVELLPIEINKPAITSSVKPTRPNTVKFLDLPFADMVYIPGGIFQMGDTHNEGESDEKPIHSVTISGFLMGKYEITQRQWESVMGNNPSYFKDCPDCPVENVSWEDVQDFLIKLNIRTKGNYRLPTEAEWEYAAGGGNSLGSRFGNGQYLLNPAQANFNATALHSYLYSIAGEYRQKTTRVGSFNPNNLGLYDLCGNVWEWCSDWYSIYKSTILANPNGPTSGSVRVLRGGSWLTPPQYCRVTVRGQGLPNNFSLPSITRHSLTKDLRSYPSILDPIGTNNLKNGYQIRLPNPSVGFRIVHTAL